MSGEIMVRRAFPDELETVRRLTEREYRKLGYLGEDDKSGRSGLHPAIDFTNDRRTKTYVAIENNGIVGTISVTTDHDSGLLPLRGNLPPDKKFPKEMILVRMSARNIAYFWRFAVSGSSRGIATSMLLREAMLPVLADESVSWAMCIVHPRHSRFYRGMRFEEVAVSHDTPPSALLACDVDDVRRSQDELLSHASRVVWRK